MVDSLQNYFFFWMLGAIRALQTVASPLASDGWLEWNARMWDVKPERVTYQPDGPNGPRLEGVLYLNRKRGQVCLPPRNPYLPFAFVSSGKDRPDQLYRQRMAAADCLAADLINRGIDGTIALAPGFMDGRVYKWNDLEVGVRYTFVTPLPVDEAVISSSVKKKIRKAREAGYTVKRSEDWASIDVCLRETEQAKSFSHRTGPDALALCRELLGDDAFRAYAGISPEGEVVGTHVRLLAPSGTAIGWSQGTFRSHLPSGINQLLYAEGNDDLVAASARWLDLAGANIRSVAEAKAAWGFPLVPYLTICQPDFRQLLKSIITLARKRLARLRHRQPPLTVK